ncbi:MAG: tRNA pseudouridine(55) synthase TruB [Clostridia bacterium]
MNGILIINKEKGCTSHDMVYKVKKIFNEKVGHTGTLDPLAEGVLPILIGKGTLCSKYLINHDKKYIVNLALGQKTETADLEGKIIEEKNIPDKSLTQSKIEKVLKSFIGKQQQMPPIYSAIKVNGKKLYEYARKGQNVEIKPRKIEIYDIKLMNIDAQKKQIQFEVFCGKGTYIRSLCEDIAEKLETVGYMESLKRIQVGNFKIEESSRIQELEENKEDTKYLESKIISIEEIFKNKGKIKLDDRKMQLFLNGVKITQNQENDIYRIYDKNAKFIGIGIIQDKLLKRDIILD